MQDPGTPQKKFFTRHYNIPEIHTITVSRLLKRRFCYGILSTESSTSNSIGCNRQKSLSATSLIMQESQQKGIHEPVRTL